MTLCTAVGPQEDCQQLVGTTQHRILRISNSLEQHLYKSTLVHIFFTMEICHQLQKEDSHYKCCIYGNI